MLLPVVGKNITNIITQMRSDIIMMMIFVIMMDRKLNKEIIVNF